MHFDMHNGGLIGELMEGSGRMSRCSARHVAGTSKLNYADHFAATTIPTAVFQ